jgi:hypothetical protein
LSPKLPKNDPKNPELPQASKSFLKGQKKLSQNPKPSSNPHKILGTFADNQKQQQMMPLPTLNESFYTQGTSQSLIF